VAAGQRIPLDLRTSPTLTAMRGSRRVIQPRRTVLVERLYRVTVVDGSTARQSLIGERFLRTPLDQLSTGARGSRRHPAGCLPGMSIWTWWPLLTSELLPGVGEITRLG